MNQKNNDKIIAESEYHPDVVSFYMYELEKLFNNKYRIKYIKPVNIPNWLAIRCLIKNWSYEAIKFETKKAFLFIGENYKGEDKWIPKSQMEIGQGIKKGDKYYNTHRNYIIEHEKKLNIDII